MTEAAHTSESETKVPSARGEKSGRSTTSSESTEASRPSIADSVVAKIAGMATREMGGVYEMGGGAARALGAVRDRIPGSTSTSTVARGVTVEVGERQAAVDLQFVVEYGVSIPDLAAAVRRNVVTAVEGMTGLEVTEINISIEDIHLPGDDEGGGSGQSEPRVE
ncbi:putative alkaline shock family protein YloU [Lipingzhangella halophila]|uniref:Putative alkaline shock family protein YloU n=1 Tax=Lipingzhangella halophila TaxID=1783352 RepID=A0A7W7RPG9_9ACTN|nr:Asp23/Gls24 family envelope stress response protein [Lipingzhangella halophila]MBB4935243.1 putative alkaline shock family protein YloU [Lipingzhangella halophila]